LSLVENIVAVVPKRWLGRILKHSEMLKFLTVGAITFVSTVFIFFSLKWTILQGNPVTANVIAVLISTIVSYVLNKEWSFAARGGRPQHHEAALFFGVAGAGMVINQIPLWISRYVLDLRTPYYSFFTENVADLVSGTLIGTLLATAFRWWAMSRFVFLQAGRTADDNASGTGDDITESSPNQG
jgi:putative flippase GtrA